LYLETGKEHGMGEEKDSKITAVIDRRSEYGSSGGIGYYSQVRVSYGDQTQMQEWQWRDRYSASKDRPWMAVNEIGEIEVVEEENEVIVRVELINHKYGTRTATYKFKPTVTATTIQTLSAEEQSEFQTKLEAEIQRIMDWKQSLRDRCPRESGAGCYLPPKIKRQDNLQEVGIAAFIIESQIDYSGDDRQMRLELYVFRHGNDKAELLVEDHGYNKREGGAFLIIIDMTAEHILINTKGGKREIKL